MAVTTNYGSHVRAAANELPKGQADTRYFDNRLRNLFEKVTFIAGDSVGSTGYFGQLPSDAIIDPTSKIYHGAAGGTTDLDIGDINDPDGFATDIDISLAGSADFLEAVLAADKIKPLWELLGYASDPGGNLDLYCTIATATVTTGFDVVFAIKWSV